MAKLNVVAVGLCVLFGLLAGRSAAGYYDPSVEDTVQQEVEKAIGANPGVGPALIRLLFHDCWVYGCDGSVLLDHTPYNSTSGTEKNAANNIGLGGFDLINTIKAKVGDGVSCADILAFAARDAARYLSGGKITYYIDGGRKDGVVSSAVYADATLPGSTFSFQQLHDNFKAKGFTDEELVVVSGAHSIGQCHYTSFQDRFSAPADEIDPRYQLALHNSVTAKQLLGSSNPTELNNIRDDDVAFRVLSGYNSAGVNQKNGVLDNSYYAATLQNMVLLHSDWVLRTNNFTAGKLVEYRDNATDWILDFAAAMAKLSSLPAEGEYLEIRKDCRVTNKQSYP